MKKHNLLVVSLLVLAAMATGCGNKANKVVVQTHAMPTGPVQLQLNWPLGRHGTESMTTEQTMDMTVPGVPNPMKQEMNMGQDSTITVVPGTDPGSRALELQYVDTRMKSTMNGKEVINYDSSKGAPAKPNDPGAILNKMIGAKIRFVLDASNQVQSVEGADDLAQRMTGGAGADPAGTMRAMFSSDSLKQQIDFHNYLPGKPVQPGDSWPVTQEFHLGQMGTIDLNFTLTLESWEKIGDRYFAKISSEGTVTSKPGDAAGMNGMTFSFHDGKTSGETLFDLDMGMFTKSTIYMDLQMDISVPNPRARRDPKLPKTMDIKAAMHQTIETKFELN